MERDSSLKRPFEYPSLAGDRGRASRLAPVRLPYAARSFSDLLVLRAHLSSLRRSGRGFQIDEGLLDASTRSRIELASATYAKACGCGFAGAVAMASLAGGWGWSAATRFKDGFQWMDIAVLGAVLPCAIALSAAAKAAAISWSRLKLARTMDAAIAAARNAQGDTR